MTSKHRWFRSLSWLRLAGTLLAPASPLLRHPRSAVRESCRKSSRRSDRRGRSRGVRGGGRHGPGEVFRNERDKTCTSDRDVSVCAGHDTGVEDTVRVRCPYCREWVDLYVDPDTTGMLVEDCAVCCRPWAVTVERDAGRLRVHVSRAQ